MTKYKTNNMSIAKDTKEEHQSYSCDERRFE